MTPGGSAAVRHGGDPHDRLSGAGTDAMAPGAPRVRPATDLRLLAPAVLAWVAAAAALGLEVPGHLVLAGGAAVVAVVASAVPRPRQGGGVRWALVLALVLVVLLQVAAAAHAVVRARGGIEALAADRAAVTAVVVVTGDPFVLAGRGDSARVLRDGTVEVIDAGTRRAVGAPSC